MKLDKFAKKKSKYISPFVVKSVKNNRTVVIIKNETNYKVNIYYITPFRER